MTSFFLTDAQTLAQGTPVMSLHAVLDWQSIRSQLKGLYLREVSNAGGPIPYDALGMFKLMLLGQWHGLSDTQLEHALRVRIDFMVFTGLEPSAGELPQASTICRFRNRLVKAHAHQRLLKEVNRQLERAGLKVSGAQGAIIDATIIPAAARPHTEIEVDGDEVDGDDAQTPPTVSLCADAQARWTKKGKKSFLGYKGYSAVDAEDGYTEVVSVAPANESEVNKLQGLVQAITEARGQAPHGILADKGYHSAANRELLKDKGIADFIQHKASRNTSLHTWQKQFNALVAKVRFKVEQSYGTMKRRFHLSRARYFGRAKVEAQMVWAALGMNLLKAQRKIEQIRAAQGVSAS